MSDSNSSDVLHFNDTFLFDNIPGGFLDLICRMPVKINIVVVVLFILSFFGIIGNMCLLLVIFSNQRLRNTPNILIINVAVADIMYIVSNAPFYMLHELGRPCWGYGFVACQLRHYIPQVAQGGCIFSLTSLSRERYVAIVKGLESRISRSVRRTIMAASFAWIFGLGIGIPVLFLTSTTLGGINCLYMPLRTTASKAYMIFLFIVVYLIPLVFIAVHYYHIARSLCHSTVTTLAQHSSGSAEQMKGRRRLAQVVLVITLFFGIFWLPHYVFYMWSFYTKHGHYIEANVPFVRIFRYIDYYMALANSCLDPWIVFVMSSVHRKTLTKLKSRLVRKARGSYGSGRGGGHRLSEHTYVKSVNVIDTKCKIFRGILVFIC
ncbi:bombesin receptor subtype-3-like [Amphiura filiformis]|uniref:bombesin receptor subtype-3-like n=1 Tax=Amphiura filiformis TaxID=82378 RepID=UPI003B20C568